MSNEKKSILEILPQKQVFFLGVIVAFFAITSVGFFVLLFSGVSLGNNSSNTKTAVERVAAPTPQPSVAPTAPPTPTNIQVAAVTEDDWYKGAKDASITIVEYSDTECPFCKRFHDTMNQVIENYGDSVKWVYRHAPLDSLHRKARREAMALECAGDLAGNDGFWKYADTLFARTPSNDGLADSELFTIAKDVGLNEGKFTDCLESEKFAADVQADLDDAQKAGLRGTPYSVLMVADQKIPISGAQPYAQVEQLIQSVLN